MVNRESIYLIDILNMGSNALFQTNHRLNHRFLNFLAPMETHLRRFVPGTARVSAPHDCVALHDDRLVSAALIAEADRLVQEGKISVGRAVSIVNADYDPLDDLPEF